MQQCESNTVRTVDLMCHKTSHVPTGGLLAVLQVACRDGLLVPVVVKGVISKGWHGR
jgi:hypothetical protein